MGDITIFFKSGRVIGSCPVGQERNWIHAREEAGMPSQQYDSMKKSTDERWYNCVRVRCHASEDVAQQEL